MTAILSLFLGFAYADAVTIEFIGNRLIVTKSDTEYTFYLSKEDLAEINKGNSNFIVDKVCKEIKCSPVKED